MARNPDAILLSDYAFDDVDDGNTYGEVSVNCSAYTYSTSCPDGYTYDEGYSGACFAMLGEGALSYWDAEDACLEEKSGGWPMEGFYGDSDLVNLKNMITNDTSTVQLITTVRCKHCTNCLGFLVKRHLSPRYHFLFIPDPLSALRTGQYFWVGEASVEDFTEAQFTLENAEPAFEDVCFTMRFDSEASKFSGRYVDCETATADTVCIDYPPENPCENETSDGLPRVDKLINTNLDKVKARDQFVDRTRQEYKSVYKQLNLTAAYERLFDLLWYSTLPCYSVKEKADSEEIDTTMLKKCKWKGERVPCSGIFDMFPTDRGMCCTFNMEKADVIFQESRFQKSIGRLQALDREEGKSLAKFQMPEWYSERNEPTAQAGVSKGLSLVLDAHTDLLAAGTVSEDFQGFFAVVDARDAYPQTDLKNIRIRPGYDNLVALSAVDVTANKRIKDVDIDDRQCYFRDEYKLELHSYYTQASCMLECRIAYVQQNISCIPWFVDKNTCTTCVHSN